MPEYDGVLALERMERAVWKVKDRLLRASAALEKAGVPYVVVGGNAVGAWIEQIDETAVRATQDVDLAIRLGLPHSYTIFGRVTDGIEAVDAIAESKTDRSDRPQSEVKISKIEITES
jgi:hypothetical protein